MGRDEYGVDKDRAYKLYVECSRFLEIRKEKTPECIIGLLKCPLRVQSYCVIGI